MSTTVIFTLSIQLLFITAVVTQYIGPVIHNAEINTPIAGLPGGLTSVPGLPAIAPGGFTSGNLVVKNSSPVAPTGLSVLAENLVIDGTLAVSGNLPFLGTVSVDGNVPAGGQSSVVYECGNGKVGIVNEGLPTPVAPAALGSNMPSFGRAPGLSNGFGFAGGVANNLGRLGRIGGV